MTDSNPRNTGGELWSFLRRVMSQGKDIHLDHQFKPYEEYSARMDAAAGERVDQLFELLLQLGVRIDGHADETTACPKHGYAGTCPLCATEKTSI